MVKQMSNKITQADFRKLQAEQKGSGKPKKVHANDKEVDYWAICAQPKWKVETSLGIASYTLPMPPSANEYWRSFAVKGKVRVVLSAKAKSYKEAVADLAHRLGMKPEVSHGVAVSIKVYRNQASGDLDNRIKVTLDALRGVAFEDDKQVVEIYAQRFEDKGNGRIVISVTPRPW